MPSIKICTRSASWIVARRFGLPFIKRTMSSNCAFNPVARVSVGSEDEGSNRPPDDTVSMANSEILRLVLEPFTVTSWRSGCAPPTLPMIVTGRPAPFTKRAATWVSHKSPCAGYSGSAQTNSSGPKIRSLKNRKCEITSRVMPPSSRNRSQSAVCCHARGQCA